MDSTNGTRKLAHDDFLCALQHDQSITRTFIDMPAATVPLRGHDPAPDPIEYETGNPREITGRLFVCERLVEFVELYIYRKRLVLSQI